MSLRASLSTLVDACTSSCEEWHGGLVACKIFNMESWHIIACKANCKASWEKSSFAQIASFLPHFSHLICLLGLCSYSHLGCPPFCHCHLAQNLLRCSRSQPLQFHLTFTNSINQNYHENQYSNYD